MLEVGQKLYLYDMDGRYRHKPPVEVTVQKVGRKWADIDARRRVNIETLWVDAGQYSPSHRCYPSPADRQRELDLGDAWYAFQEAVRRHYQPPADVEAIRKAAELLGLQLTPRS